MSHRSANATRNLGYFGIGVYQPKFGVNVGTLWRSAFAMGASFFFTIGERFPKEAWRNIVRADHALGQQSDTTVTHRHIPYMRFDSIEAARQGLPMADFIGVELDARAEPLQGFSHPKRAAYLLGAEDNGLPQAVLDECFGIVQIPGTYCLNVSVAGSIVLYDRVAKSANALALAAK